MLGALALSTVPASWAQEEGDRLHRAPIASRNTTPIYANQGVPVQRDAKALAPGAWDIGWQLHWASHSLRESRDGLDLELDGETRRHDLNLRAGLVRGLNLEVSIPWISHDGGSLDNLIEGWHKFWGLPNGARDEQPEDELLFAYSGSDGFLLESETSGVGDVEVGLSWELGVVDGARIATFVQVKLDTGSARDFTGSGDTAYALGLRATADRCVSPRLSCHAQLGYVHSGDLEFAPDTDPHAWFAGVSLAWAINGNWAVVGQLDSRAERFDEGPLATAGTPVLGTLGLRWTPDQRWLLEAHFSEDLAVGSAPDITFLLGASRRF